MATRFDRWRQVSTLLRFDDADGATSFADEVDPTRLWAVNGNAASQAVVAGPFGGTSAVVDGAGDRIYDTDASYVLDDRDFTIEGWFRPNAASSAADGRIFQMGTNATQGGLWITRRGSTSPMQLQVQTHSDVSYREVGGDVVTALTDLTWVYITVTRRSGVYYTFINGVLISTVDETGSIANFITASDVMFGANDSVAEPVAGHYSDWRITQNVALYIEDFTPPTAPLAGDGYVVDTQLVNRDFEDAAAWVSNVPTGWTVADGLPRKDALTDDGGTSALGSEATQATTVYQDINIPNSAVKMRFNGRVKSSTTDWDNPWAGITFYDAGGFAVGGAMVSLNVDTVSYYSGFEEAWVPSGAITARVYAGLGRNGATGLNAHVLGVDVEWLEDPSYTPYFTATKVINGTFETGDTTGWLDSSAYTDLPDVFQDAGGPENLNSYVVRRTAPGVANSLIGSLEQLDIDVPPGSGAVVLSAITTTRHENENDRVRLGLDIKDAIGAIIETRQVWGPTYTSPSNYYVGVSLDVGVLPDGASKVDVSLDWWQGADNDDLCNAVIDDVQLLFYNDTTPIDESEQLYVRKADNSWFHVNPVFTEGQKGMVPDPILSTGQKYLRDDGTWQYVDGGAVVSGGGFGGVGTWRFKTGGSTTPLSGNMTHNGVSDDFSAATHLYFHDTNRESIDTTNIWANLIVAGSYLYLQEPSDSTLTYVYEVVSQTEVANVVDVTVVFQGESTGGDAPNNTNLGLLVIGAGGGGGSDLNIDGGIAESIYTPSQVIDGGTA